MAAAMGNQYGCNRCMYTWDGSEYCPMCGQPATHEIKQDVEAV